MKLIVKPSYPPDFTTWSVTDHGFSRPLRFNRKAILVEPGFRTPIKLGKSGRWGLDERLVVAKLHPERSTNDC
jgi:hypothetical protein